MAEIRTPTPEVQINPVEALQQVKSHRMFESRNIGQFFEAKTDPESIKATQWGDRTTITGDVANSKLSLRIDDFNGAPGLRIFNLNRRPSFKDSLGAIATVFHGDGLLIGKGGLEGGYRGMLSHPDAAETLKFIQELTETDRRTRNVHTVLEGYPHVWENPITRAYLKVIEEFTDPTQLLFVDSHFTRPRGDYLVGIIDDPRLHLPGDIKLQFNGRSPFGKDKTPFCWVNWFRDNGEPFKHPMQTVFKYDQENNAFSFGDDTFNLDKGTVRSELSEKMLTSLNEGRKAPEGFGGKARTFLRRVQA